MAHTEAGPAAERGDAQVPVERAVGVDALDPKDLRALLQDALRRYLPDEELAVHVARDEEIIDVMSEPGTNGRSWRWSSVG